MLCKATCRRGDGKCDILCQRVQGSVRAVWNTRVFLMDTRVVTDERVIQRLMTDQVHATLAPDTSQPPPGSIGIRGSLNPTSGLFGICGSTEPTPGSSDSCGFSAKSFDLPMYEGK